MERQKKIIPCIYGEKLAEAAKAYDHSGADAVSYYDEKITAETVKEIAKDIDIPLYAGGGIEDLEDVKKILYAGADKVCLGKTVLVDKEIVKKAGDRFGKDQIIVSVDLESQEEPVSFAKEMARRGAGELLLLADKGYETFASLIKEIKEVSGLPVMVSISDPKEAVRILELTGADDLAVASRETFGVMELKHECRAAKFGVNTFESSMSFDEFKLNSDGMLTVVTQDYKTNEVLMVAYMTKEAFEKTVETGIMTYYSRSRNELWTKGDTSGHYQYVKSLTIDCDKDTLLAKVEQVGNACHTGSYSCFFTDLVKKEYKDDNPMEVFQSVYDVIMDRKKHPKEGSYTNYLFEKGIDKILKKVGEEATEIVIAAKNPDVEEMKYEISDFLYHLMVLMAERGMTWDEVTRELIERK